MSTFDTPLATSSPWTVPQRRRRPRWPFVLLTVALLLVALVVAARFINVPYYALVPGDATPVAKLISVPAAEAHPLRGHLLLTDVGVENLNLLGWVSAKLNSNDTLVRSSDLTENLPVSEFNAQGTVDMAESQLTAESVALRQLGYQVPEKDVGVTLYVIDPGSPAWHSLHVGDVVTSIDGTPTPNPLALQKAVRSHQPGEVITLQVGSIDDPLPGHSVTLKLARMVEHGVTEPFIGIGDPASPLPGMGTQPEYQFPFSVKINSDDIGGPSAGLAWTLGIIDSVSGGGITNGHTIAATGTIDPDGSIGDVGGVEQKTVAVERAGASAFFVPDANPQTLAAAKAKATPNLEVFGVSTIQQVLRDLKSLGGKLGSAAKGPPPGPGGHSVPNDWQDSPWS
jgi:PDZ domain-containing protein